MPGTTNQGENVSRVRPLTAGITNGGNTGDIPFRQVIQDELAAVQKNRADLMTPQDPRGIHLVVLFLCVLVNVIFYLSRPDYFGLFIAASFYLNMYYFITLILPTNFKKAVSRQQISRGSAPG